MQGRDPRPEALATARQILEGKATGWRFSELERLLLQAGFEAIHGRGSHRVYRAPGTRARVLLVEKSGELLPAYAKDAAKAVIAKLEGESDAQGE